MDPVNYMLQVQQPFQAAAQGYQVGSAIRNDQLQQDQQQQQIQQQQAAAQRAQAMQRASLAVAQNPTPQSIAQLSIAFPEMSKQFKDANDILAPAQQQSRIAQATPVYAAMVSGRPDVAAQLLTQQADAMENSGDQQGAQHARVMAQWATTHPDSFKMSAGMMLSAAMGPDKFADTFKAIEPASIQKSQADADKATVDATVDSATAGDQVAKAGLDNAKTQQEIDASKLAGQVAQLNVQIAQANSETERGKLVLERDKLVAQQQQQQQTQGQAAQSSLDSAASALDTLNSIKTHPGMTGFFTGPGTALGSLKAFNQLPGSDRQALEGYVDSLKSQLAYSNLQSAKAASPNGSSGFGALSDGELKLLSNVVANLDLNSKDFPKQLAKVEGYLNKVQQTSLAKPGAPTGGGAFVVQNPLYGTIREGDINRLMKEHPGATRQQVLDFLQQAEDSRLRAQGLPTR